MPKEKTIKEKLDDAYVLFSEAKMEIAGVHGNTIAEAAVVGFFIDTIKKIMREKRVEFVWDLLGSVEKHLSKENISMIILSIDGLNPEDLEDE